MPRRVIAEPLPLDLRNRSFRGKTYERQNFSGRDIRGCDFRNARLKGSTFSGARAGRSQKQVIATFAATIVAIIVVTGAVAVAVEFPSGIAVVVISLAGGFARVIADVDAGAVAGAGAFASFKALEAFGKAQISLGIIWGVVASLFMLFVLYRVRKVASLLLICSVSLFHPNTSPSKAKTPRKSA